MIRFLRTVATAAFEDFVDVREVAIAKTLTSGGAAHAAFLPLIVKHGFADLIELFLFGGLHFIRPCADHAWPVCDSGFLLRYVFYRRRSFFRNHRLRCRLW